MARAVSGPSKGKSLSLVPTTYTIWAVAHVNGSVLGINTGHRRDYERDPSAGCDKTRRLYFDVTNRDRRFYEKDPVVVLVLDGQSKVWPLRDLAKMGGGQLTDWINDTELHIRYALTDKTVVIREANGKTSQVCRGIGWLGWCFIPIRWSSRLMINKP